MRARVAHVAICLAFLATGCVRFQEKISLERNGSGTVDITISAPSDVFVKPGTLPQFRRQRALELLGRQAVEERLGAHGLELTEYDHVQGDSLWRWEMAYRFESLEAFRLSRDEGRGVAIRRPNAATYEIELFYAARAFAAEVRKPGAETPTEGAGDLLEGARFEVELRLPSDVVSTPGGTQEGPRAMFNWRYGPGADDAPTESVRTIFARDGIEWPVFEELPRTDVDEDPYLGPSDYMDG